MNATCKKQRAKQRLHAKCVELQRALVMQRSLGTRVAAGFLRNQNWSIESALVILTSTVIGRKVL